MTRKYKKHQVPVLPVRQKAEYDKPSAIQVELQIYRKEVEIRLERRELKEAMREVWE